MVKQVLLALAIAGLNLSTSMAQDKVKALRFCSVDGSVYMSLKYELKFDFSKEDQILVSYENCDPIVFKASDMGGMSYTEVQEDKITNGIMLPTTEDVFVENTLEGYALNGLKEGETVSIFSSAGTLVETMKAGNNGKADLKLSHLPSGIYMIKANNRKTLKIEKL